MGAWRMWDFLPVSLDLSTILCEILYTFSTQEASRAYHFDFAGIHPISAVGNTR